MDLLWLWILSSRRTSWMSNLPSNGTPKRCFLFRDAGALKSSPAFNAAFETRDIGWPNARRFLNLHFWISRDFSGQWWFKTRDHKAKPVRFPLIKICKDVFCRIKAGYRLPTPIFLGRFIQILIGKWIHYKILVGTRLMQLQKKWTDEPELNTAVYS